MTAANASSIACFHGSAEALTPRSFSMPGGAMFAMVSSSTNISCAAAIKSRDRPIPTPWGRPACTEVEVDLVELPTEMNERGRSRVPWETVDAQLRLFSLTT